METLEQADVHDAGSKETAPAQRRPRWSRTHTIWLTIALSLLPGVAAALFRAHWAAAPGGMRLGAYVASAVLILAACFFIVMGEDNRDS